VRQVPALLSPTNSRERTKPRPAPTPARARAHAVCYASQSKSPPNSIQHLAQQFPSRDGVQSKIKKAVGKPRGSELGWLQDNTAQPVSAASTSSSSGVGSGTISLPHAVLLSIDILVDFEAESSSSSCSGFEVLSHYLSTEIHKDFVHIGSPPR
jgi:hypothetical protein